MPTLNIEASSPRMCLLGVCALFLLLCGCTGTQGDLAWSRTELYFGMGMGDGKTVSDAAWQAFLDTEVTPRFPDGLTVLPARGQWRGEDGKIASEPTHVLIILHPQSVEARHKFDEIRNAYKRAFKQECVLLSTQPTRVSF